MGVQNMGHSVLVFISHSTEDEKSLIEPIVQNLEECYINTWLDKRNIVPGDNLKKSIFKDGLDKADVVLIFFTEKSLQSSWIDSEITHILSEERKCGNDFNLNKIISIFDSKETYDQIIDQYPELTDDHLHLMPESYNKIQLGQLITAIWSKYFLLQGGDIESQKQLLAKDKELFQKDKIIKSLENDLNESIFQNQPPEVEFQKYLDTKELTGFVHQMDLLLTNNFISTDDIKNSAPALAFGLLKNESEFSALTRKGHDFFKWYILHRV